MLPQSDAERHGDRVWRAFEAHGRDVYRFVHRRCGDSSLSEEVTQDVFLIALERPGEHGDALPLPWLYRVARNRMIDVLRRQHLHDRKLQMISGEADRVEAADDAVVSRVQIETALGGLSGLHRSILMLRYVDDLSVRDLAEAFGRTERAIEGLLMRARAALRRGIEASDA